MAIKKRTLLQRIVEYNVLFWWSFEECCNELSTPVAHVLNSNNRMDELHSYVFRPEVASSAWAGQTADAGLQRHDNILPQRREGGGLQISQVAQIIRLGWKSRRVREFGRITVSSRLFSRYVKAWSCYPDVYAVVGQIRKATNNLRLPIFFINETRHENWTPTGRIAERCFIAYPQIQWISRSFRSDYRPITFFHAECLSHDTSYFRMSARTFESMLWRGSNLRPESNKRYPDHS